MIFCIFSLVFLFKQTWAIPGAALLNLLAGALWGYKALPFVSFLGATGSSFAYLLSKFWIGKLIIGTIIPKASVLSFRTTIEGQRDNLLIYMVTIRIIPLVPGWFVNLASPYVGISLPMFWLSTFIGLTPFHYICSKHIQCQ